MQGATHKHEHTRATAVLLMGGPIVDHDPTLLTQIRRPVFRFCLEASEGGRYRHVTVADRLGHHRHARSLAE